MSRNLENIQEEVDNIDLEGLKSLGVERTHENFYILGNYPPLLAMEPITETELFTETGQREADIYLHVPFCNQLCNFCHFKMDQRPRSPEDTRVAEYLGYLKKEIDLVVQKTRGLVARSLYIGGGTPSFLKPEQIEDLFSHLHRRIEVPEGATVTLDVHPELIRSTTREQLLQVLKQYGVNRIAIGGVDLNDQVLRLQQRGHTARESVSLIQELKLKGFDNVAVDLMMGTPQQTPEGWANSLEILAGDFCKTDCIMTFPLMFKANQINWRQFRRNPGRFPSMRERMIMQLAAADVLGARGYTQLPTYYFNRSSDKVNDQQVNKFTAIEKTGLFPIGMSSFGFYNGYEFFNHPSYRDYYSAIDKGELPVWRGAKLTDRHLAERRLMFGLKAGGVNTAVLNNEYGLNPEAEFASFITEAVSYGLLEYDGTILKLTRHGQLFAEEICDKFAGEDIRQKAAARSKRTNPTSDLQRFNYNKIGHRLETENLMK